MDSNGIRRACTAVAAVLAAALAALLVGHYLWAPGGPFDLAVYREAGAAVLSGGQLYSAEFGRGLGNPLPFTYPPIAALLAVPLALAPLALDYIVWTTAALATLVGFIALRLRHSSLAARLGLPLIITVFLWLTPATDTLIVGQLGVFVTFGCLWACTCRRPAAGAVAGLLGAVKLTPLVFVAYFALTRQWARFAWSLGAFAGLTAVAWAILPDESAKYFGNLAASAGRIGDPAFYSNQSLLAVTTRVGLWSVLWVPLALFALGFGLSLAARCHRNGSAALAAVSVGTASLLVSPVSWQHHAVWVVPALVILAPLATSPADRAMLAVAFALNLSRLPFAGSLVPSWSWIAPVREVMLDSGTASYVLLLVVIWRLVPRHRAQVPQFQRTA